MQIYDHDTPEEITYKNSSIELDNWLAHLYYIEKEIANLFKLGNVEQSKIIESEPIHHKLLTKKEDNSNTITAFLKYKDTLPKAAECEDVDCDMFYITEHEKFRKTYLSHLNKYREVKEEYFKALSK